MVKDAVHNVSWLLRTILYITELAKIASYNHKKPIVTISNWIELNEGMIKGMIKKNNIQYVLLKKHGKQKIIPILKDIIIQYKGKNILYLAALLKPCISRTLHSGISTKLENYETEEILICCRTRNNSNSEFYRSNLNMGEGEGTVKVFCRV